MCCILLAAVGLQAAQTYQRDVTFQATGQSLFMGDKSAGYNFSKSWNESKSASDSINTYLLGSWGGGFDASCSGGMSLGFTGTVRDAAIDILYPITVTMTYPDNGVLYPGDTFTISTAFAPDAAATMSMSSLSANLKVNARLHGSFSLDAWLELASEDVFDDEICGIGFDTGTKTLFDTGWRDSWDKKFGDYMTLHVEKPSITATGSLSGTKLVASGRSKFATMNGNITNMACKLAGIPEPNKKGSYDIGVTASYDTKLASLETDMAISLGQDVTFTPTPTVMLTLSTGQVVTLPIGKTITFTMPSVPAGTKTNDIAFTPQCTLPSTVAGTTKMILGSGLYFDPLTAKASMGIKHVGDVDLNFDPFSRYALIGGELPITLVSDSQSVNKFTAATLPGFTLKGYVYPTPQVTAIAPIMIRQGSGASQLTVSGSNFVPVHGINPSTKVLWDGQERVTQFVSANTVRASLTAADNADEGIHQIAALNPPPGGGVSPATLPYIVDGTPPETSNALVGPEGLREWFIGDVIVSLSATDNLCGVAATRYTLDDAGAIEQTFGLPTTPPPFFGPFNTDVFNVTGDAIHTVNYNSEDNVGNTETVQEQIIKIDTTRPELTAELNPARLWPPNGKMVNVRVWGRMTDNLSGIDRDSAFYTVVDEYGLVQPGGPVVVNEDGTYEFTTRLQASRLGKDRDGRLYTIIVSVCDMAGWQNSTTATTVVPHDQR
jgi:hypothetical protein